MNELPSDRRGGARVEMPAKATIIHARSNEPAEVVIRDLSATGARLVSRVPFIDGEQIRIRIELGGAELSIAAEIVRTDPQNSQFAIAFRDMTPETQETIERSIAALIDKVRTASPPTVLILGAPAETREALERDLARLGRGARPCTTLLETIWALQDPMAQIEAIVIASDVPGELLAELLAHLAERHARVRRILLFGQQLGSVDHASSSRVDAVLRTPLRLKALARALDLDKTESSVALLAWTDPDQ